MDGPIRNVEPPRILPLPGPGRAGERGGRGAKRFALDPEEDAGESHEELARPVEHDCHVGPAAPDEAGARVDVTA